MSTRLNLNRNQFFKKDLIGLLLDWIFKKLYQGARVMWDK